MRKIVFLRVRLVDNSERLRRLFRRRRSAVQPLARKTFERHTRLQETFRCQANRGVYDTVVVRYWFPHFWPHGVSSRRSRRTFFVARVNVRRKRVYITRRQRPVDGCCVFGCSARFLKFQSKIRRRLRRMPCLRRLWHTSPSTHLLISRDVTPPRINKRLRKIMGRYCTFLI